MKGFLLTRDCSFMDTEASHRRLLQFGRRCVLIYAAVAMLAGVLLGFVAWKLPSQACGMLAVVLLLSSPLLAVLATLPEPADSAVHGAAIDRIDRSLRLVHFCRAHIGVACAGVMVQWASQLLGLIRLHDFLMFCTVTCLVAAVACLPWLASCEMRLHDQRAAHRRALGDTFPDLNT
jgi:hypothetical protein